MTSEMKCIDATGVPFTREGQIYATNNQFQKTGPKGFFQIKVLENDDLYVRVDLPGVPDDAIRHRVDAVRQKVVFFAGESAKDVDGIREYSGSAGLGCDCCEITNVDAKMKDGVLRMIVSRVKVKDHETKCSLTLPPFTGKSGRKLEDHPFVVNGRKRAFLVKPSKDQSVFMTVDVPGVSSDGVEVMANETELRFRAEIKNVYEHDESGRVYLGSITSCCHGGTPMSFLTRTMAWNCQFGVLQILVCDKDNKYEEQARQLKDNTSNNEDQALPELKDNNNNNNEDQALPELSQLSI